MKSKLTAYAMDFASFLFQKTKFSDSIKNIILFGSVSRGEDDNNSDIDIFIDVVSDSKKYDFNKCVSDFFNSAKYKNYWHPLGIDNEIKLAIGVLDEWKELKPSIISNGILLYGKFKSGIKEGTYSVIFNWENIKPNSKRVLFNKQMFGYNKNKRFYNGFIQKYNAERLGKGAIVVPLEHFNLFNNLFKKYKITVKIKKFLEY